MEKQPSASIQEVEKRKNEKKEDFHFHLPCNIFVFGPFITCLFVLDFFLQFIT